jgi:DNA-binding beta-propeller fold protein YncE
MLSEPVGLALDSAGNLYIADQGNNRIRRVDTHGIITTFAGAGTPG